MTEFRGYYYSTPLSDNPDHPDFNLYVAMHVYTTSFEEAKVAGRILARRPFCTPIRVIKSDEA